MALSNVLDLAARQASWLLTRENLVAQNVANANTPGYRTNDLSPFEAAIQTASLHLTTTSPRHISITESELQPAPDEVTTAKSDTFLSGNNVSLEIGDDEGRRNKSRLFAECSCCEGVHRDARAIGEGVDDMDNLTATFSIAGSGLFAQSQRIRVASENLANAESTGNAPGANPYTRKVISFESELDEASGANLVQASRYGTG